MAKKETPDCGKHCKMPTAERHSYHCKKKCCHGRPVTPRGKLAAIVKRGK